MDPIVISPSQALLILIEHHLKLKDKDIREAEELIKLYMNGAEDPDKRKLIEEYFIKYAGLLSNYRISFEPEIIDSDPTRRYFESYIALFTLENELGTLAREPLEAYVRDMETHLKTIDNESLYDDYEKLITGMEPPSYAPELEQYAEYLKRITNGELLKDLPQASKDKIILIIRATVLPIFYDQFAKSLNLVKSIDDDDDDDDSKSLDDKLEGDSKYKHLPIDIYDTGIFSEESRGKTLLSVYKYDDDDNKIYDHSINTGSQNLGLMKGQMALSKDDALYASNSFPYLKASDQARYNIMAEWVKLSFSHLVHPFSNSISGTVLVQLRALAFCQSQQLISKQNPLLYFQSHQDFLLFFRTYAATLLLFTGGHSLFEYTYPIRLQEVQEEFTKLGAQINWNELDVYNIFSGRPETVFAALEKAVAYNNRMLQRKKLNQELNDEAPIEPQSNKALDFLNEKHFTSIMSTIDSLLENPQIRTLQNVLSVARECMKPSKMEHGLDAINLIIRSPEFSGKNLLSQVKTNFDLLQKQVESLYQDLKETLETIYIQLKELEESRLLDSAQMGTLKDEWASINLMQTDNTIEVITRIINNPELANNEQAQMVRNSFILLREKVTWTLD